MADTTGVGSEERPLRVAVVGAGPAGFYAVEALVKRADDVPVRVDLFERLPAPFGLVRYGVAPDHQKIKKAAVAYDRTARKPGVRYLGNVDVGRDVSVEALRRAYDAVILTIGSSTDRQLNVPGEDAIGSVAATRFVAWYNGHPDYVDDEFDLNVERAVVVGVGNVAMDVARILVRSVDELATTDIADYALDALRASRVREVLILGRRGAGQAAFDLAEIKAIAELDGVQVIVDPAQIREALDDDTLDAASRRKVEYLAELAEVPEGDAPRKVRLRFLASPVELIEHDGHVRRVRIERNVLVEKDGRIRPRGTGEVDEVDAGMVVRSVGYRGVPVPGVPFDEWRGVIANDAGRVIDGSEVVTGLYVAGWIKRGPTGLVGTNKACATETVKLLLEDVAEGRIPPAAGHPNDVLGELERTKLRVIGYDDWLRIDERELADGRESGRVRRKITTVAEMLSLLES